MSNQDVDAKELSERYPYLSDYLNTIFFEQGASIYGSYEEALRRFLDSSGEAADVLTAELLVERNRFYYEFVTLEDQIAAFYGLGGAARSEEALDRFLPRPE